MSNSGVFFNYVTLAIFLLIVPHYIEGRYVACITTTTVSNSTHDLWYKPSQGGHSDPLACVEACQSASFRYSGFSEGSSACACGNAYGSNAGSMADCAACRRRNDLVCGSGESFAVYETFVSGPPAPRIVELGQRTTNALQILWEPPDVPRTMLRGYRITAKPIYSYSSNNVEMRTWEVLEPDLKSTYLISLTPATQYEVSLVAIGSNEDSKPVKRVFWTKIGVPDSPQAPNVVWRDGQKMKVSLTRAGNSKGPVSFYRLALIDDQQFGFSSNSKVEWKQAKDFGVPYYIAAQWSADDLPSTFVVGNEDKVGGFYNGLIPNEGHWHPALGLGSILENITEITYSSTGHFQHSHLKDSEVHQEDVKEIVIDNSDTAMVVTLWIAVGIASITLLACFTIFIMLKFHIKPGRSALRRNQRREMHPLAHTSSSSSQNAIVSTISVPSFNDYESGGYSHFAFMTEEEDWGRKALASLTTLPYISRASISLPGDDGERSIHAIGTGRFGPVHATTCNDNNVHLHELPSPIMAPSTNGNKCWDEPMYRALQTLVHPSAHPNVLSLLGFLQTEKNLFLVSPADDRILKTELLELRNRSPKCSRSLILCAMGIAEGLFHLHSYSLRHGNLCSWTVVLPNPNDWENPKLSGFGILESDSLDKQRNRTLWMSLEGLHSRSAPPCDAWSFGILLWEIATLGGSPYGDIKTDEVKRRVERGARPPQLDYMGDGLYQLMLTCWQIDKDERPDAGSLACQLYDLLPIANEELDLSHTAAYPPYTESLEFISSTN